MLTFSLFLISVVRHPGQRFLLYDGALLLLAAASSQQSAPSACDHHSLAPTLAPLFHPKSLNCPRAGWGTQQMWLGADGHGWVRHNRSSWCGRPNHRWCFTVGLLTEARQEEKSLILRQIMFKRHSVDTINWNMASKPLQVVKFKYWILNWLKWWCRNLQFYLFTSFCLWAEEKKGINKEDRTAENKVFNGY